MPAEQTGPQGPPTQDRANDLTSVDQVDASTDVEVPGLMVVHPSYVTGDTPSVDLTADPIEQSEEIRDLDELHASFGGGIDFKGGKVHWRGRYSVRGHRPVLIGLVLLALVIIPLSGQGMAAIASAAPEHATLGIVLIALLDGVVLFLIGILVWPSLRKKL